MKNAYLSESQYNTSKTIKKSNDENNMEHTTENNNDEDDSEDKNVLLEYDIRDIEKSIDFYVITQVHWPTDQCQGFKGLILPQTVLSGMEAFKHFYLNSHQGRKLDWQLGVGNVVLKLNLPGGMATGLQSQSTPKKSSKFQISKYS